MIQNIAQTLLGLARDHPLDVLLLLIIVWQVWYIRKITGSALSWYRAYDAEATEVHRLKSVAKRKRAKVIR